MAALQLSLQNFLSTPTLTSVLRPPKSGRLTHLLPRLLQSRTPAFKPNTQNSKWVVRFNLVDQSPPKSTVDVGRLVDFLYEDLSHLFDEQGIDRTAYDEQVRFRDPITKHDTISGYLFNISLLREIFRPEFFLHWVKQVLFFANFLNVMNPLQRPYEITTRWTMIMKFALLPWKPELIFTGTSIMGINPETGKFCSHVDLWDSIQNNDYFSVEGLWDVFKQLRFYKTPELESPKYLILKRTAKYEVRKYAPFIVVETSGDKLAGSAGFNTVAGYIFGKNSTKEKIPMTTPVFTQTFDSESPKVSIQIVLPSEKDIDSLPDPEQDIIGLRKVEGGIAAVLKFSGKPTEEIVQEKAKELRSSLIKDGLKPRNGCLLARYNDPGRTWNFIMRNEVLIWLEEWSLE
ncbi:SOUL heme-binding family protein isoform 1 [Cucumis melo var. makuwa]|uniref:SOUL heme-binding family protein isoform 1 n=1 Tax=Cucumis melo var. makuwa TaxID=1194695 RepID=A0A5D3CLD5_CUCMM|nr:SOUL heme-binding family protein isoform 1 [Cucumis melo var. makuwa]